MTRNDVLQQLATGEITVAEAEKLIAIHAGAGAKLSSKISAKGACSVYGLGRFPVTLYVEQWERLFEFVDSIRAFLKAHDSELKRKVKDE